MRRRTFAGWWPTVLLAGALTGGALAAAGPAPLRAEKLVTLSLLEDRRAPEPALRAFREDPDPAVRVRAARALGRIGFPELAPALAPLLADPVAAVRAEAAFDLGLLLLAFADPDLPQAGWTGPEIVTALVPALGDPDAGVRAAAAAAIGRFPTPAGWAALAERLSREQAPRALQAMLLAVWRFGEQERTPVLVPHLTHPESAVRWRAVYSLARAGEAAALPHLLTLAVDGDPFIRSLAARGLGGLADASSEPTLQSLTRDRNPQTRINAWRALKKSGSEVPFPVLEAGVRDRDPNVRLSAIAAAAPVFETRDRDRSPGEGRIGAVPLPPDAFALFRRLDRTYRRARRPVFRRAVLEPLIAAGLEGKSEEWIVPVAARDRHWFVRAGLAALFRAVAASEDPALLDRLLGDADARVLAAALETLGTVRQGAAVPVLREHLAHEDVIVRLTAAAQLAELEGAGVGEALRAAFLDSVERGEQNDLRLSILDRLGEREGEGALPFLRTRGLTDPDRLVRRRAAAAIARVTGAPVDRRHAAAPTADPPPAFDADPIAVIQTSAGLIRVRLLAAEAPRTVANFLRLARAGFYDGQTWHRVVPNFVIQGGCPRGDGNGGPDWQIRCEINRVPYGRGTMGMALSGKDTGGSQFFITHSPQPHLDGRYTVFGQVVAGMPVVDRIVQGDAIRSVRIAAGPGRRSARSRE